jgi:hypothetical protein
MFLKRSLKFKLIALGVILSVAPLGVVAFSTFYQNRHMTAAAADGLTRVAHENLTNTVTGIRTMAATQNEIVQKQVVYSLNVARRVMQDGGGLFLDNAETASWRAVNQYTKASVALDLPHMTLGGEWLQQNADGGTPTPLVDEVKLLVGGTCTVFQRMNEEGDMLRVATNVEKLDGTRAIGTYIPAVNPDGRPNPVVASLLGNKTYYGRAYVVNAWYLTAYEPLFNNDGETIGALYFGVKQESTPASLETGWPVTRRLKRYSPWTLRKASAIIDLPACGIGANVKHHCAKGANYWVGPFPFGLEANGLRHLVDPATPSQPLFMELFQLAGSLQGIQEVSGPIDQKAVFGHGDAQRFKGQG